MPHGPRKYRHKHKYPKAITVHEAFFIPKHWPGLAKNALIFGMGFVWVVFIVALMLGAVDHA